MHCPNCRQDNAATTRFCTSCGAVLVENAPGGGRRRVLRPWGLNRSAPLTVSPTMPEIVAMRDSARPLSRRLDLRFAAGTAVVALAGSFLYPYARALDAPPVERVAPTEPVIVSTTSSHAVRDTVVAAPPLVEPLRTPARTVAVVAAPRATPPRDAVTRAPVAPPPSPVVEAPPTEAPPPPVIVAQAPAPVAPRDRWQPLKDALAGCSAKSGLWERATCEQGARLAHCDGAWGEAALCPLARSDYGQ